MGVVTTSLAKRAESIFTDLGYAVSREGEGLRAERKWRVVHVTLSVPEEVPTAGDFRCFVARKDDADAVHERVLEADPDYDWALLALIEGGDYEVQRAPMQV